MHHWRESCSSFSLCVRVRVCMCALWGNFFFPWALCCGGTPEGVLPLVWSQPRGVGAENFLEYEADFLYDWRTARPFWQDMYQDLGVQCVEDAFAGINSCLFSFGQPKTGKTAILFGTDVSMGVVGKVRETACGAPCVSSCEATPTPILSCFHLTSRMCKYWFSIWLHGALCLHFCCTRRCACLWGP